MRLAVTIKEIWISPGHDFVGRHGKGRLAHGVTAVDSVRCVTGSGLEGDRYFGHREDYKGQITFFAEEIAQRLEDALDIGPVDRSVMRRNVLIEGVDLNSLIGRRFALGEVSFSGSEECAPCYWMDEAVGPGAHAFLKGNGGLRCRIESTGSLHRGPATLILL